jgi:hypothetical protein
MQVDESRENPDLVLSDVPVTLCGESQLCVSPLS